MALLSITVPRVIRDPREVRAPLDRRRDVAGPQAVRPKGPRDRAQPDRRNAALTEGYGSGCSRCGFSLAKVSLWH